MHSVQFSLSVVSDSLRPHELQHTRPPCPSPTPGVHPRWTHVHRVGDAIQPSHPLSSPSPPAPNPSQHQSLFQWVNSPHEAGGYHSLLQEIFPTQELNPGLPHCRQMLYHLSHHGSPPKHYALVIWKTLVHWVMQNFLILTCLITWY